MVQFQSVLIFDTETTSLPCYGSGVKIIELAAWGAEVAHLLKPGNPPRVLHKLVLLFNPMKLVHPTATDLTGLCNTLLQNVLPFRKEDAEILKAFITRLPSPVCIIAHNGYKFDFPILRRALEQVNSGFPDTIYCVDSLVAFKELLPKAANSLRDRRPQAKKESSHQVQLPQAKKEDCHQGQLPQTKKEGSQGQLPQTKKEGSQGQLPQTKKESSHQAQLPQAKTEDSKIPQNQSTLFGNTADQKSNLKRPLPDEDDMTYWESLVKAFVEDKNPFPEVPLKKAAGQEAEAPAAAGQGASADEMFAEDPELPEDWEEIVERAVREAEGRERPKSYKLKDVYQFLLGVEMSDSHRAENDCSSLLKCVVSCKGFFDWMNKNAVVFNSIKPL